MAADEEGDAVMAEAEDKSQAAAADTPATASGDEAASATAADSEEPAGPSAEERITTAEVAKEAGNALLKSGDFEGAVAKYVEGIGLVEPLLEKTESDIPEEELRRRRTAVYVALCLNATQACIKQSKWADATDHANRVLAIEKENAKALFRRAVACMQFDTESRLEQARADLARFVQLEPSNREARDHLQKVKERLKEAKQREKERYAQAMTGGLYSENHKKLDRQKLEYEEEVKRREEADPPEEKISWEDWQKKLKEKEESDKKKEKEARETRAKALAEEEEQRQLSEENARRKEQGLEEMTLEDWRTAQKNAPRKEEVMQTDEADLDEEEKKLLEENKIKGYYHGRLGTVLSDAAPKPQQMREASPEVIESGGKRGSAWNEAGTWEEKDTSDWVKERLTEWLKGAVVGGRSAKLASAEEVTISADISKVKSLDGDAQVVTVRKKPRFGYNFVGELSFRIRVKPQESLDEEMPAASDGDSPEKVEDSSTTKASVQRFDGTLKLPDLSDSTQPEDLRFDATWKSHSPPEHLQATVLECLQELKKSVREQVSGFVREYHATA